MKYFGFACAMLVVVFAVPAVRGLADPTVVQAGAAALGTVAVAIGLCMLAPALIVRRCGWPRLYAVVHKMQAHQ